MPPSCCMRHATTKCFVECIKERHLRYSPLLPARVLLARLIVLLGHVSHSFLWSLASPQQSTFDPVESFVCAVNLHRECPPTLLKALANSHPDREVWLQSYYKEKHRIESLNIYPKITLGEYQALWEKGCIKQSCYVHFNN